MTSAWRQTRGCTGPWTELSSRDQSSRRFWAYAAAFGASWGVIEITVGSFLHALRLPLAGWLMAALGVMILVAQRQLLPRPGLTLCTGIIAAACKSLSPGGVLLGPMVGITSEALIVEVALLLGSRALPSTTLAGALAVQWPLVQSVLTHYLLYGGAIMTLYLQGVERISLVIGTAETAWWILASLVALWALFGSAAALLGRHLGRLAASASHDALDPTLDSALLNRGQANVTSELTQDTSSRAKTSWMAAIAVACVLLQANGDLISSVSTLAIWLSALALGARRALRRLWVPRFWAISLLIALASGLLLGDPDAVVLGLPVSRRGLEAGALMVTRGVFVFALMAWASRALASLRLQRTLEKIGLGGLASALGVATGLLPALTEQLRRGGGMRTNGLRLRPHRAVSAVAEILARAAAIAERLASATHFEASPPLPRKVIAIVGAPGSGKTSLLTKITASLKSRGVRVGGILQPALESADGRRGYLLFDVANGEQRDFAVRAPGAGRLGMDYTFDSQGWSWAAQRIHDAHRDAEVLVLDELGRLEAHGEGHWPAVTSREPSTASQLWLLGVRADCASLIQAQIGKFDLELRAGDEVEVEQLAAQIAADLGRRSPKEVVPYETDSDPHSVEHAL